MGEKFGKFEIITKLATGGMAEIFLARQVGIEGFQKLIVLKRILPHLSNDKEFVNMFLDEARMAAQLNHPNIVQIYDLGVINDSYFIAMEYIDGVDLSSVLKKGREQKNFLRLGWILKIISQVCEGLYYAHTLKDANGQSLGLIHRDITPENIMLSFNGNVKITDFGIARARGRSTSTTSGTLKGKFPYMSYEMVKGMEIDSRSDIFSLGIVMWEMLTYRRLFKRETEVASINAILNEEIPSPKRYFKNLPDEVEAIVMKALERDRDKRFQTAREMGNAIEDFIIKKRVSVRISDLSEYLKNLFPNKEISSLKEKLSSSKLQRMVEVKEQKSLSNSLPIVTIQKKNPVSESETIVLPKLSAEDVQGVGKNVNSIQKVGDKIDEIEGNVAEVNVPDTDIKPLAEVMEEVNKEIAQKESESEKDLEMEKGEVVDESLNMGNREVTQVPPTLVVEKRGSSSIVWIVSALVSVLVFVIVVIFVLNLGKKEEVVTKPEASVGKSGEIVKGEEVKEREQKEEEKDINQGMVQEKQISERGEANRIKEPSKKGEQKVAVVDKPKIPEKKQGVEKVVDKEGEKQQREEKVNTASVEIKKGFLSIDSDPWTEVYLEGKKIGETPLVKYELPSGAYNVVLKNYEYGFEKTIKVTINPDENTINKIKFGKGFLEIRTNVEVEVRLGGNLIGKTPITNMDMYEGTYRLNLFDPVQKKSKVIKVEIKEGKTTVVNENI